MHILIVKHGHFFIQIKAKILIKLAQIKRKPKLIAIPYILRIINSFLKKKSNKTIPIQYINNKASLTKEPTCKYLKKY